MRRPSSVITCKTHRPTPRFSASLNALADVSKEKLDIYNPVTKATTGEPNTPEGLRKAARKTKAVVCCEPREGRPEIETGFHKYAWHTCGLL